MWSRMRSPIRKHKNTRMPLNVDVYSGCKVGRIGLLGEGGGGGRRVSLIRGGAKRAIKRKLDYFLKMLANVFKFCHCD